MNSTKGTEPLPCPICGENGDVTITTIASAYSFVRCFECEIEGPLGAEDEDAIKNWNEYASNVVVEDFSGDLFEQIFSDAKMQEADIDFTVTLREGDKVQITSLGGTKGESYEVIRSKDGELCPVLNSHYYCPYIPNIDISTIQTVGEALGLVDRWLPIEEMKLGDMECGTPFLLWSPDTHTYPCVGRYWSQDMCWTEDRFYEAHIFPTHFKKLTPPVVKE